MIFIARGSNNLKGNGTDTLGSKHSLEPEGVNSGVPTNAPTFEDKYQPTPEGHDIPAPKIKSVVVTIDIMGSPHATTRKEI